MTAFPIEILPYKEEHQADIDILMTSIANEYSENIFSSQFKKIKELSFLPTHTYWVASINGTVVGTSGLLTMKNNNVELKRMFLLKEFRGQGVAKILLDTAVNSAIDRGTSCIYLGTMAQFRSAQTFYEKNGFIKIPESLLPPDFSINPVDTVFYKKELK